MRTKPILIKSLAFGVFNLCILMFYTNCNHGEVGACFTASDNNVSPNEVVTFTNCSSLQTADQACYWSFGDGEDMTIYGNSPVQHSYSQMGQYEVKLMTGEGSKESTHTLEFSVF